MHTSSRTPYVCISLLWRLYARQRPQADHLMSEASLHVYRPLAACSWQATGCKASVLPCCTLWSDLPTGTAMCRAQQCAGLGSCLADRGRPSVALPDRFAL